MNPQEIVPVYRVGLVDLSEFYHIPGKKEVILRTPLMLKETYDKRIENNIQPVFQPFIPNENEIRKKGPDFHISNINKNLNGKEFTKKVTQKMYKRCLSALSGGPRDTLQKYGYRYNFTTVNNNCIRNLL